MLAALILSGLAPLSAAGTLEEVCAEFYAAGYDIEKEAEIARSWKPLDTAAGVETLVGRIADLVQQLDKYGPDKSRDMERSACNGLLRYSRLPEQEIGIVIARRAQQAGDDVKLLNTLLAMADRRAYGDDLIPFFTQYLDDRRRVPRPMAGHPDWMGLTIRISDAATGSLLNILERKNITSRKDPRFSEPADQMSYAGRDARTGRLIALLEEHGLMYYQNVSAPCVVRKSALNMTGEAPVSPKRTDPKTMPAHLHSPRTGPEDKTEYSTWGFLVAGGVLLASALLLAVRRYIRRRQ